MRRYLIIFCATIVAVLVFFIALKVIKKITKKNSLFYPITCGLISFIFVLLIGFLYLEKSSSDIGFKYFPPKYIDGKVLEGKFSK